MNGEVEEVWKVIPEFPSYKISNLGRVYSIRRDHIMRTSLNSSGHVKITLVSDYDGYRHTRSVAQFVAEAFVEPPDLLCDSVVLLDDNLENVAFWNLVWRPGWYAWKYARQLRKPIPLHFKNLRVVNLETAQKYDSIVEAGTTEGLLFDDIWRSTYTGAALFPNRSIFAVIR